MKNIKEKINKWEELNKLLPKTVNRFRVYEIIKEIEKQSFSLQKQEIVEKIEKPENWDNWSIERQLGYNFALNQLNQKLT